MKKLWLSGLLGLAAVGSAGGTANAQGSLDHISWNQNACIKKRTLAENKAMVLSPEGAARSQIAHRGIFTGNLPGSSHRPGENTIVSFIAAECAGFAGVEIDLKYTKPANGVYELVMEHEWNFSRHNNMDGNNGHLDPDYDAEIRVWDPAQQKKVTSRPFASYRNFPPSIATRTWDQIQNTVNAIKMVDEDGAFVGLAPDYAPQNLNLENALNYAKAPNGHLDSLVFVLDIQNHRTLQKVLEYVDRNNLWNRVVLKIWLEALPYSNTSPDFVLPENGNYVFAINPFNTRLTNVTSGDTEVRLYNVDTGQETWVNQAYFEILTEALITNMFFYPKSDYSFEGLEVLINGSPTANHQLDDRLRSLLTRFETAFHIGTSNRWGVIRGVDYKQRSQTPSGIPTGDYFATYGDNNLPVDDPGYQGWPLFQQEAPGTVEARNAWANHFRVFVEDVRYPGRSVNSQRMIATAVVSVIR